jgi:hypothetical protein
LLLVNDSDGSHSLCKTNVPYSSGKALETRDSIGDGRAAAAAQMRSATTAILQAAAAVPTPKLFNRIPVSIF